jgi:hypothetical protein
VATSLLVAAAGSPLLGLQEHEGEKDMVLAFSLRRRQSGQEQEGGRQSHLAAMRAIHQVRVPVDRNNSLEHSDWEGVVWDGVLTMLIDVLGGGVGWRRALVGAR